MTRKNGCRLPSPLTCLLYRNTLVGTRTVQHQIRTDRGSLRDVYSEVNEFLTLHIGHVVHCVSILQTFGAVVTLHHLCAFTHLEINMQWPGSIISS